MPVAALTGVVSVPTLADAVQVSILKVASAGVVTPVRVTIAVDKVLPIWMLIKLLAIPPVTVKLSAALPVVSTGIRRAAPGAPGVLVKTPAVDRTVLAV